jgi:hypothetical protein
MIDCFSTNSMIISSKFQVAKAKGTERFLMKQLASLIYIYVYFKKKLS